MKLLPIKSSLDYLNSIADIFEYDDRGQIDKYLNSKSWHFWIFANIPNRLPLFFWDESDAKKHFEAVIGLSGIIEDEDDGKKYSITKYGLSGKFTEFLLSKNQSCLLTIGNFDPFKDLGRGAIEIEAGELTKFFSEQWFADIYFFSQDLSWMLAFNHHGNGFLGGTSKFITDFADFFPGYRKFANYHDCLSCSQ